MEPEPFTVSNITRSVSTRRGEKKREKKKNSLEREREKKKLTFPVVVGRDEFALHKLDHIIKIKHQNVYKDGFELEDQVDAVFLDLPAPWDALEHAKKAMRASHTTTSCSRCSCAKS